MSEISSEENQGGAQSEGEGAVAPEFAFNLILISEYFYPDQPGGAMHYSRFSPLLAKRGVRSHAVTVKRPHHSEHDDEFLGIKIHRMQYTEDQLEKKNIRTLLFKDALKLREKLLPEPTVLAHLTIGPGLRNSVALILGRMSGAKSVRINTIMPEIPNWGVIKRFRWKMSCWLESRGFDMNFYLTERMKDAYVKWGYPDRNVAILPNGVNLERFRPPEDGENTRVRKELGIAESKEVVLYVGAFIKRKRLDLLLEAWPKVLEKKPNALLLAVGGQLERPTYASGELAEEYNEFQKRLNDLAGGISQKDSVMMLNEIEDVEKVYRVANLYTLPTDLEGFPSVMLEAMASALPVLCNRFDGFPRDTDSNASLREWVRLCTGGADEWASEIVRLLEDADERQRMGAGGRKWVEENQSLEAVAEGQFNAYKQVLGLD